MKPPSRPRPPAVWPAHPPSVPAGRPPAVAPARREDPDDSRALEPVEPPAGSPTPDTPVPAVTGWRPVRPPVVSTGSAARFAERAAFRRRLRHRRAAWIGAAALVLGALGWVAFGSSVFALRMTEVIVTGEGSVVEPGAVRAVIGAHEDTPLPRLDTVALRRTILDVPGVRSVEIVRQWPHGLAVAVVAREPVAAVPAPEGDLVLLDAEGVQVGRVAGEPGLPVVSVPLDDEDARALRAVLSVLDRAPVELTAQVTTISAQSQDTVSFSLADGSRVEWGSSDQVALKAEVLATLRAAEAGLGPRVFDVSAPTAPITRAP